MSPRPDPVTEAWQSALAAEQQAVFGYQLLGPRLGSGEQPLALAYSSVHEALRDTVGAEMVGAALTPVAAKPDYPALYPVPDAAAARRLAARLEDDCAAAWRYLYATAASAAVKPATATMLAGRRAEAQTALIASARRATGWRIRAGISPALGPFPGI